MSEPVAWVRGELVPRAAARLSIDDASVKYGAAVFETMRASQGKVFRWERHLERLRRGLDGMGVQAPSETELASAVSSTLEANELTESRVRLSVSAGSMVAPDLSAAGSPTVTVTVDPLSRAAVDPVELRVSSLRVDESRPLGFAKTAQYLIYLLARGEARTAGAGDALLLNHRAEVCEAATANVFALIGGGLVTPSVDAGPVIGVARGVVMELAAEQGLACEERRLRLAELGEATELFLTNSIVGVQPIGRVDGEDGEALWLAPSADRRVTPRLAEAYALAVAQECGGE